MSFEDNIVGRKVVDAQYVHDYIQLYLDEQAILSVYNEYSMVGISDIRLLVGCEIVAIDETSKFLKICFMPEATLVIGLMDSDHNGPEALQYRPTNWPTIIWS